ncbi:calcineurin-like phosphoesterase C-terminal domain-containing protein [Terrimonas alba]|uniref:calcineurin-like phosphoesterase C-terminal domain-containing protein n=1 Tax=Terrimonas alba TaxID=3349636 RepID=UPI0035F2BBFA
MKRRLFIQNITWLTGGTIAACQLPAETFEAGKKIKGKVTANRKGIKDAVVSDGYTVITTDAKGRYELIPHPSASNIFISTPSGYEFKNQNGIARHYHSLSDINRKNADFELIPLIKDDNEHQFVIWADPQVKNQNDVDKLMTQSVPDVQKWVAAAGNGALLHGITVGDIVWDELHLFPAYNAAVEKIGIPFFQCIGNHDMDYNKGGDETSDQTFQQHYGPTHYSFNRGKVHYVVMDDVRYLGKDREYDGYISQNQLDWLQKDLSFVPKEHLIVLCVHIPVHNGIKNSEALYAVLGDRKAHIMSGHTHYHRNVIKENIFEHNHGTVCGAWWTGPICGDGTPCGYGVYNVKGTELSWHYQATGESADHQMKIFVDEMNGEKQVQVNIWNYDPEWRTEYWIDGNNKGSLQQTEAFDPVAYATLLGPDLPKPRGFAEPRKTEHMFKAAVPSSFSEIKVVATDRFGKKYSATYKV